MKICLVYHLFLRGFYLYMHHGLCPVLWTACRCARWGSLQHYHGSGPPLACRSQLQAQLWSWHILQTPFCQTSPPAWPAVCSSPGLSASRCFPDPASIHHQYCQNLAVKCSDKKNIISTLKKSFVNALWKALEQLLWMSGDDSGCCSWSGGNYEFSSTMGLFFCQGTLF